MPVEIRELLIQTHIVSRHPVERESLDAQQLATLKKQIVQECLKVLGEKNTKNGFDR